MRPLCLVLLLAFSSLQAAAASALDTLVEGLYRPWQADLVALSPDGEHLAYTRHEKGELAIYLMTVGHSEKRFKIAVEDDRPVLFSREKQPAQLRFLAWASPTRIVFAPTPYNNDVRITASIFAVDLDGAHAATLAKSDDFALPYPSAPAGTEPFMDRDTRLHGFLPGDRTHLLVEALGKPARGGDLFPTTMFTLDVNTGKLKALADDIEDGRYLYDPAGGSHVVYSQPRFAYTRNFRLKLGTTWDRWVKLNEASAGPLAKPFVVSTDNYYGERAIPLGIDLNPEILYYASNVGRDTYGIYALNVRTKERVPLALEDPHVDLAPLDTVRAAAILVRDPATGKFLGVRASGVTRFTSWLDPEMAALQRELDPKFPQRSAELLQWDDARRRLLVRSSGGTEPGRYYVYQRPENVLVEVLRSTPWLRSADLHTAQPFAFDTPGGVHLTGYLTFPRKPRLNPPPLIIDFADGALNRAEPGFDRNAQVLAEMGFVVARLNHRGTTGFGLAHLQALRSGGDRVPVDDAVAAVEWIAAHHPVDRHRVATLGREMGGYFALRALQLAPDVFRCGIAIDAPLSPEAWLRPAIDASAPGLDSSPLQANIFQRAPTASGGSQLTFNEEAKRVFFLDGPKPLGSVLRDSDTLTKPVMLIVNGPPSGEIALQASRLNSALKRRNIPVDLLQTEAEGTENLPGARTKTYHRIETFFNINLYDFGVKVGPTKEIK